jgi:hypothetical protein
MGSLPPHCLAGASVFAAPLGEPGTGACVGLLEFWAGVGCADAAGTLAVGARASVLAAPLGAAPPLTGACVGLLEFCAGLAGAEAAGTPAAEPGDSVLAAPLGGAPVTGACVGLLELV